MTQLELQIRDARKSSMMTTQELIDYIIQLYGKELERANMELSKCRDDKRRMEQLESRVFTNREGEHEIHLDFTVGSLREACDLMHSAGSRIKT